MSSVNAIRLTMSEGSKERVKVGFLSNAIRHDCGNLAVAHRSMERPSIEV
jgi:hypothetical protein